MERKEGKYREIGKNYYGRTKEDLGYQEIGCRCYSTGAKFVSDGPGFYEEKKNTFWI